MEAQKAERRDIGRAGLYHYFEERPDLEMELADKHGYLFGLKKP